jgi:glycosyltransferase involved in cell wall biosynthesis
MKVLTINSSDIEGGAARAAYRLHQGLLRVGAGSRLMVQGRSSDDPFVEGPPDTLLGKAFAKMRPSLDLRPVRRYPNWQGRMFSPAWIPAGKLVERINASDADIVHLHWVAGGMLRVEDLAAIRKPLVWSMHDMWPFTGGCHYDEECGRFTSHCGRCPILGSVQEKDLSHRVFERKLRTFRGMPPITFVGLSSWMADSAKSSALLGGHAVEQLPNAIDTEVFKPMDRVEARRMLGLPLDRTIVLFGAVNATADPRKGFAHLSAALKELPVGSVELAIFGASRPLDPPRLEHPFHYMGRFGDDISLCLLYNAADVTVVPSVQENLSNTIVESLSCGTPAVGFAIGGNVDMIDHLRNGYLAKAFDASDLARGISHVLDPVNAPALRDQARRTALERFELEHVARRYLALYDGVLERQGKRTS